MKVYLCGGINGLSDQDAQNWREWVKEHLLCETLDPMRRDYRGIEDKNVDAIVSGDLEDIKECDIVLVNAVRPSWGTAMEVAIAKREMKKMVIVGCPVSVSPWLRSHADHVFNTVGQGVEWINALIQGHPSPIRTGRKGAKPSCA